LSFRAVGTAPGDSPYIPPDSVGDVGPTQILVHVNGRVRVFDKAGNVGALDASESAFWSAVAGGQGVTDPNVRYDRISARWFLSAINLAATNNRVLIAVSSGPIVTDSTSFTFFYFTIDAGGAGDRNNFCDFPSLGVDANALYIGCNMFSTSSFEHSTGFVVRKSSVAGAGPIVVTAFKNLTGGTSAGPYSPRGVDNDDPQATAGYFVGVDVATLGRIVVRRVSNPGGTPSISGNLNVTVPATAQPLAQIVRGSSTGLDPSDDRLFIASIRKNKITGATTLWTAHNIAVDAACVASAAGAGRRNGGRWYEIGNLGGAPALVQAGTLCDTATVAPKGFVYPSVTITGQGHATIGASFAGSNDYAGAAVSGRLRTDSPGATWAAAYPQAGLASYRIIDGLGRNRWGDYSFTDVDPGDDQTVWTFQEYADAPANNWAIRVLRIDAPPPATPSSASPASVCAGLASVHVTVTGASSAGTEFFDPGPDTGGPGFAHRLSASVDGSVSVVSAQFVDPTHVTLDVSTLGATAGPRNVTVTNPDGQSATGSGIFTVIAPDPPAASNEGPVCAGGTLRLHAEAPPGATYAWTGPGGFSSSEQNPVIVGAGAAAAGSYLVTATIGGCASPAATTEVVVLSEGSACDDGDAATCSDACAGGACAGTLVAEPFEVGPTLRLARSPVDTTLEWSDPAGPFDVYRGVNGAAPWSYGQGCLEQGVTGDSYSNADVPPAGQFFYYLVSRVDRCRESALGRDSSGAPIPNGSPCLERASLR
jgi:hypothetical protein